jgi:hypothetical protein
MSAELDMKTRNEVRIEIFMGIVRVPSLTRRSS